MSEQSLEMCESCFNTTKYRCILCCVPFCCKCTHFEEDEDTDGWVIGKSVGYCNPCFADKIKEEK